MGNWLVEPRDRPAALAPAAIESLRLQTVGGFSRRTFLGRSLALGLGLWLTETVAGTVGFLWPNLKGGFGGPVVVGDYTAVAASPAIADAGAGFADGGPAYLQEAQSFVVLLDPSHGFDSGSSPEGDGAATNVRTLYQRCTHLGCKPNFCARNFWFECPCHGSRYDRLGIKVANLGPAPRGLDRFASSVDAKGVLTIDTGKLTLGPLPVALGQEGLIPPRAATGCI